MSEKEEVEEILKDIEELKVLAKVILKQTKTVPET